MKNTTKKEGTALKEFFEKLKKHWITVWLVLAVLAVGVFATFAAYTGIYSVKRVVSMSQPAGVLFSSNSMQSYSGDAIPSRHITTSQSSGSYTYNLTVCDFAQSDPLTRYISDTGIRYELTAQLCVKLNNSFYAVNDETNVNPTIRAHAASKQFSISYVSDGGVPVTGSVIHSLSDGNLVNYDSGLIRPQGSGNIISNGTNKYAITFDEYELNDNQEYDYYVKVTATPTNGDSSLQPIACYLYLTKMVTANSAWRDRLQETGNTSVYDAYNYIIEGTGTGTVRVRWNSSYIDVSEIFLAQNELTNSVVLEEADGQGDVWKYFDLDVGDTVNGTVISRYEIQLYKNNENGDYSNVSSYISCSYKAD